MSVKVTVRVEVTDQLGQDGPFIYEDTVTEGFGGNPIFVVRTFVQIMARIEHRMAAVIKERFGELKDD